MRQAQRWRKKDEAGPAIAALAFVVALAGAAPAAHAQQGRASAPDPAATRAGIEGKPGEETGELSGKRMELRGLEDTMSASLEQRRKIEAEIATIRADRARLSQTLIEAAQRVASIEAKAAEAETRLDAMTGSQDAIVRSLESRRALIGEVLAVLQRMGRRPPPALLVRPEDILEAIRASMLLGAVLPQMRSETEALEADLAELVRLRDQIKAEKTSLAHEIIELNWQRARLAALIDARQQALLQARSALAAEAERIRAVAAQASSLKELIARMEGEVDAARRAAEAARQADAAREAADAALSQELRAKALAAPFRNAARLAPAIAFADLKGRLPLPAAGAIVKPYGAPDGFGGTEKGVSIGVRDNGLVVAPCDGWIAFSGKYRTYGQLLIINAGSGYYVVLAGMDRINVEVGQFILAGEPVANMGDGGLRTAAAIAVGAKQPILYVEFRKDGTSIDSAPWWVKPNIQKVGG
ncbi:MAG: peptidoglycan DD-metalloendopeptidase family protein [Methylocystis sp.]|nr:peptidoglycan DD-metalloendopeptidase family protein [Methylocystis sp.]